MLLRCPNCKKIINEDSKYAIITDTVHKKEGVICPHCKTTIWREETE